MRHALWMLGRAFITSIAIVAAGSAGAGDGSKRVALVIGNGTYTSMPALKLAENDATELQKKLQSIGFTAEIEKNLADKQAFDGAIDRFVDKHLSEKGTEVLFFFSGHGLGSEKHGNFYLPTGIDSEDKFLKVTPNATKDAWITPEQKRAGYMGYIDKSAISEADVIKRLRAKDPRVVVFIADACRNLYPNAKGAKLASGVALYGDQAEGVFRFYSARPGQSSYEPPSNEPPAKKKPAAKKKAKTAPAEPSLAEPSPAKTSDEPKPTSLFTSVFLRYIAKPGQQLAQVAEETKNEVYRLATANGVEQLPDLDNAIAGEYTLYPRGDAASLCVQSDAFVGLLFRDAERGGLTRESVERARSDYSECPGVYARLTRLLQAIDQGFGTTSVLGIEDAPESDNSNLDACDVLASSPLDPNRPQGLRRTRELRDEALTAFSKGSEPAIAAAKAKIDSAVEACRVATEDSKKKKVARFQYNLANALEARSMLIDGPERDAALGAAFAANKRAADLNYVPAHNRMGVFYENGLVSAAPDGTGLDVTETRKKAFDSYVKGARLGDIVAQYNLGLKYLRGAIGLPVDKREAYTWFAKAAEGGYVPAMIEAALLLFEQRGQLENPEPDRAKLLLEQAARRGSAEAMYQLGYLYEWGRSFPVTTTSGKKTVTEEKILVPADDDEAIVWYARAAETGHTTAQVRMARMLAEGLGLPSPQPVAAGRYWRLAAQAGSEVAQVEFAALLRAGTIPLRPGIGASEIKQLYESAVARGSARSALVLAQLYRAGEPVLGEALFLQSYDEAARYAKRTIDLVKAADPEDVGANPSYEFEAALMLIDMVDKGEVKGTLTWPDGATYDLDANIAGLKVDYGDPAKLQRYNVPTNGCRGQPLIEVLIWDWQRDEPPSEPQFRWFERFWNCPVPEAYRNEFIKQFAAAKKDKVSFADLMAARIAAINAPTQQN